MAPFLRNSFLTQTELTTLKKISNKYCCYAGAGECQPRYIVPRPSSHSLVSFAAVFRDVTQRSSFGGALRDIPKDGCEGDYSQLGALRNFQFSRDNSKDSTLYKSFCIIIVTGEMTTRGFTDYVTF